MSKYIKKPIKIEAFKYDGDFMNKDGHYYIPEWGVHANKEGTLYFEDGELYIKTLEGVHHASVGDYIIKGIKGELYPCKPDIFEQTYTEAQNGNVGITLYDTINLMCSADYKERFKAEYLQLLIRVEGLNNMLKKYKAGKLNFKPTCSYELLSKQLKYMVDYLNLLEDRAKLEGIDLV